MISWDNKEEILKELPKEASVKLAIYAAELVVHFNDDPRVAAAIAAAKMWLNDPSEANRDATRAAGAAADARAAADAAADARAGGGAARAAAAAAAAAAVAAADAASAAAGTAAYAAAEAAYAAAAAAGAAGASAAGYGENELEIQTKILEYLKDLYFETLPLEEQTWLVRECL